MYTYTRIHKYVCLCFSLSMSMSVCAFVCICFFPSVQSVARYCRHVAHDANRISGSSVFPSVDIDRWSSAVLDSVIFICNSNPKVNSGTTNIVGRRFCLYSPWHRRPGWFPTLSSFTFTLTFHSTQPSPPSLCLSLYVSLCAHLFTDCFIHSCPVLHHGCKL